MPFLYSLGDILAHRGVRTGVGVSDPQRLFVVHRGIDPTQGETGRLWYKVRRIVDDGQNQKVDFDLLTLFEEELQPYPT